jgi:hypothetical protein
MPCTHNMDSAKQTIRQRGCVSESPRNNVSPVPMHASGLSVI